MGRKRRKEGVCGWHTSVCECVCVCVYIYLILLASQCGVIRKEQGLRKTYVQLCVSESDMMVDEQEQGHPCGRVVIVGETSEDCRFIRNGIVNGTTASSGHEHHEDECSSKESRNGNVKVDDVVWDVETKYYSAKVMVRIRELSNEGESSLSLQEDIDSDIRNADGIVLIFDASDEQSFTRTMSILANQSNSSQPQEAGGTKSHDVDRDDIDYIEAEIRLVAGIVRCNCPSRNSGGDEFSMIASIPLGADEWIDKCRDYGFELVFVIQNVVVATDEAPEPHTETEQHSKSDTCAMIENESLSFRGILLNSGYTEQKDGHAIEDMVDCCGGFKRLVDALHAHMWPGLTMRDDNSKSSRGALQSQSLEVFSTSEEGVAPGNWSEGKGNALEDISKSATSVGDSSVRKDDEDETEIIDEEEMERQMAGFEKLMSQMSRAREEASGMSDEQRREYAADIALRMLSELGYGDVESE